MSTSELDAPWAFRLVTDRLTVTESEYASVALDPGAQTAVYFDSDGRVIEMGKHGTNKPTATTTKSAGGDGENPGKGAEVNDDTVTDYEDD